MYKDEDRDEGRYIARAMMGRDWSTDEEEGDGCNSQYADTPQDEVEDEEGDEYSTSGYVEEVAAGRSVDSNSEDGVDDGE